MSSGIIIVGLLVLCITWLSVVTIIVFQMKGHYNTLTQGVTKATLEAVLTKLLNDASQKQLELKQMMRRIQDLEADGTLHIQKIGIVRFNPFADTGGNQSFTMALLDGAKNGIILTSLYSRTGGRWYSKEVKSGKGNGMVLSKEEEEAIGKAIRGNIEMHDRV